MTPISSKSPLAKPSSLRPKSEVWIQNELDAAILNAEKNRSIKGSIDPRTTKSKSSSKRASMKLASDAHNLADAHACTRAKYVSMAVSQKSSNLLQESSSSKQGYLRTCKQGDVEEPTEEMKSIPTQIQCLFDEWGCAIKQVVFQHQMRHAPQLLVLL
jgi:hypothetical protein